MSLVHEISRFDNSKNNGDLLFALATAQINQLTEKFCLIQQTV